MIDYHNIVETGKEKEIYLYVTFDYEFGPDFKEINKKMKSFNKKIIKYIKEKEINISNGKIFIVVGGVIFSTLILSNNQIVNAPKLLEGNKQIVDQIKTPVEKTEQEVFIKPKEEIKKTEEVIPKDEKKIVEKPKQTVKPAIKKEVTKPKQSPTPTIINPITVHRSSGQVITLSLEEYVIGVVSSEMPASFNAEALKAQSILARTYNLKKMKQNKRLTDTTSDQVYKDTSQLKAMWGKDFDKYYNKVKQAVNSTTGEYLTYNGEYIEAVYHSTSNGKTEDSRAVWGNSFPYLKSVDSHWDLKASSYLRTTEKEFNALKTITGIDFNEFTNIKVLERTSGNRISKIKIDDTVFTGIELRMLLGLRSADFDITIDNNNATITTRGYGHGVGMSQYGANGMANEGYSYTSILKHYYPSTIIKK